MLPSRELFTPTQRRMYDLLLEGHPVPKEVLQRCCEDELSSVQVVAVHRGDMRKILLPKGYNIICQVGGWQKGVRYQLVRLIGSAVSGYT